MRTYFPVFLAGFWVLTSCSTDSNPEQAPDPEQPDPGIGTNYNVILEENGNYSLQDFAADALEIEALSSMEVNSAAPPLFRDIEQSVLGILLPDVNCGVTVFRFNAQTVNQYSVLSGMDACAVEIIGFSQSLQASYILYTDTDPADSTDRYSVRRISADGTSFTDLALPGRAVDLDFASGKLFILAYLSEAEDESALLEFNQDLSGEAQIYPVSTGGRLLTSLGSNRLLLGYEDAHQVYDASNMNLLDNILYQPGTEPGFVMERPLSAPAGSLLYYLYDDPQTPAQERIAAIYESDRRTLVLYLIENFLSPDQRDLEYDVGTVSTVGYDWINGLLIIGYSKGNSPELGGLLRLKLKPELVFVDQIDLPGVPRVIYTGE